MPDTVGEERESTTEKPRPAAPVIVLGHQRSGTSAIAHLVSKASNSPLVDDPPWTFTANVRQVYGDDVATARYLEEHRRDVEHGILKAPALTPLAPAIERWNLALRFLVVVRNPRDNIAAALEWRRDRDANSTTDFWDMRWLGIEETDRLEMLAQRWVRHIEAAQHLNHAVWVCYDDFCGDKAGVVRRLVDSLGFERCAPIDALVDQQFKKDFGDGRIRGANRWQAELSDEQAMRIHARCNALWQSALRKCVRR
jgi:hypothetical protein